MPDFMIDEYGLSINLTLVQLGATFSLVGATVAMIFIKPDGTKVDKTPTVTNAAAGQLTYTIEDGLLDMVGDWSCRITVTKTGSRSKARFRFSVGE